VSQTDLTFVRILFNVSGTTDLTPSSISSIHTQNETLGDLFLIVNEDVSKVTGLGTLTDVYDYRIPLPTGKYVITLAYLGKDDTAGFVYAYDTINVEISDVDNFSDWSYSESQVKIHTTDHYKAYTEIHKQLAYWEAGYSNYYPNNTFEEDIALDNIYADENNIINIDISYDSTGSDAFQIDESFLAREGHLFFYDSNGIHLYDKDQLTTFVNCNEISNSMGLILFREAGVLSTDWSSIYDDWEELGINDNIEASIDFDPEMFSLEDVQSFIVETTTDTDTSDTDTSDTDTSDTVTSDTDTSDTDTSDTDTSDTDTSDTDTSDTDTSDTDTTSSKPSDTPAFEFPFEFYYLICGLIILPILRRKMK
jgi:hypothetical protein